MSSFPYILHLFLLKDSYVEGSLRLGVLTLYIQRSYLCSRILTSMAAYT